MRKILSTVILFAFIGECTGAVTWDSPGDGDVVTVEENTATGSAFQTLSATASGTISYSILTETPDEDIFNIQDTNKLALKNALDYETTQSYILQIKAKDLTDQDESDIVLNITVIDVNDEEPEFTSATAKDISTNTTVGSVVFTVASSDADSVGTRTYSIISGNDDQDFSINATTGDITLENALNIDDTQNYALGIQVTDGVFNVTQTLNFYVTNVIWTTPSDGETVVVAEDKAINTAITPLSADNAFVYTFNVDPNDERSKFTIQDEKLVLKETLEYDHGGTRSYTFTLTALGSSSRTAVITYTVNVSDVNDEPPEIVSDATLDLSKDTNTGDLVYITKATDEDTVGNVTFSIASGNTNSTFSIDEITGELTLENELDPTTTYSVVLEASDGVVTVPFTLTVTVNEIVWRDPVYGESDDVPENTAVNTTVKNLTAETAVDYSIIGSSSTFEIMNTNELVLISELDYETTTSHVILLRAVDGQGKTADITFIVNVTDVNDVRPVIEPGVSIVIPETTAVGSTIHTASATDEDTVGSVSYSIAGGNNDEIFSIDSNSGNVTLDKELSPNTLDDLSHSLIIQANDSVQLPVTQSLSITVKTEPVLTLPGGINVTENRDPPYDVWTFASTDLDNDPNPIYRIDSQSHEGVFEVSADNTKLVSKIAFDRESVSEYNVTIRVIDTSVFPLSSADTLTVTVEDKNDVSPEFTSDDRLELPDNTPVSDAYTVYTAQTVDPDITGTVTYEITDGNTDTDFNMNSNGSMSLNNALNASVTPSYSLTITANDTVNATPFTLTVVVITEPQIVQPDPDLEVPEGSYSSHLVWTVTSDDVDGDTNHTFTILEQSEDGTFFLSGNNLSTSATFDFESVKNYTVTLEVIDSSSLRRSSTATVTVHVTDVNDQRPEFSSASVQIELREDTQIGLLDEYVASTTDLDTDPEPTVAYSITDGNTNEVFSIDSTSGNLSLAKPLDEHNELSYYLTVTADDGTNEANQSVNVSVVTAPELVFSSNVEIAENTGAGIVVLVLNSTDRDNDPNPTFELLNPGTFVLDDDNTTLLTLGEIDYETTTSFNVTLRVTDSSTFQMFSENTLVITVTDENDNSPVFESGNVIEISQFQPVGDGFYTAIATDVDTVGTIKYTITDGNDAVFDIDANNGNVTIQSELSPQTVDDVRYDLTIQVNDSANTATLNLTVNVKTAPVFVLPSDNITISEDITGPYTVWVIDSDDLDGDTGVTYEIIDESVNGTFGLSADNANLTSNTSFDFETTQMYTVTLRATDNSSFTLSSTTTLTIYITDVNDNTPEFESDETVYLPETLPNGTVAYIAEATDGDVADMISFSVTAGDTDGTFSMDATSGNLTLVSELDPDTNLEYNLTLDANDSVNAATMVLRVFVVTAPVLSPVQINITENNGMGEYLVWNLTSTDVDNDIDPVYVLINQSDPDVFAINSENTSVVTDTSFDYETQTLYTFVIEVKDTSPLKLSSSATFTVSVIDENDASPNFTSISSADVREDTDIGSEVYIAVTSDLDTTGELPIYSIIGGNENGIFQIDENTGNITLASLLNASDTLTHVLHLKANDSVNFSTFNVTLNVRTAPVLLADDVTVMENADIGYAVLTLNSTDLDGDSGPRYELVTQDVPGTFEINADNTDLVVNASIDYELVKNFTLTIRVTEITDLNMTSTAEIIVNVIDRNDQSPVFESPNATDVAENTPIGEAFYTAITTDPDTSGSAMYSISDGDPDNVFAIDADNGTLALAMELNPVTVDDLIYEITIQVNDSANTATLNLTVNVKTVPVIHVAEVLLPEGEYTLRTVWVIDAIDLDGDEDLMFAIVSQSGDSEFYIRDGKIVTNATFDFENTTYYEIVINVTDSFQLSSTAILTVNITDVNDFIPIVTSNNTLVVLETAKTGEILYNTTVEDEDSVGTISFLIAGGNRDEDFSIGESSGAIVLQNSLDPQTEAGLVYDLALLVNDTVNEVEFNLTVNVKTAPELNTIDLEIEENTDTSGPFELWNVSWSDLDGDLNPVIEIAYEEVAGTFQILNNSILVTNASFDYENKTDFSVVLRITDVHGLTSNDTVDLTVTDVNDVTPEFTSNTTKHISEKTPTGPIYTASIIDPDTHPTHEYSITDGNEDGFFSIDSDTGVVTLENEFNSTTDLEYNITISANDSLNVGELNLTIKVVTVPVISAFQINITENNDPADIWNLTFYDRDDDMDPLFVIGNQSEPVFEINAAETAVFANISFDFELKKMYTFEIIITDRSPLGLSSTATFPVSVVDENDVKPEFNSSAEIQLEEDTAINTTVYTAVAIDADTVGGVSFSIIGGNDDGIFSIDDVSGNITLVSALNATETLTHVLTLQANDTLNIETFNVTFSLGTAPIMVFPDEVTVVEGVLVGSTVLTLNSIDLDGDTGPTYEIYSQSEAYAFEIENDTKLVTNTSIDYESVKNFTVTVRVTDTSKFSKSSMSEVTVKVVDVNDNTPVVTSDNETIIPENTPVGTAFYTVEADDIDTTGIISFTIIDGNPDNVFAIDAGNGSLTLQSALEPSTVDDLSYNLGIIVNDSVNTVLFNLTVNIKTAPVVHVVDIFIPESVNTTNTFEVWAINATDLDGDKDITFTILEGSEIFEIDSNGTIVTTNTTFDFETTKNYTIVINATDSVLWSTATVMVYITDVNDVVPSFTSNSTFDALETAKIDEILFEITTEDADETGNVTYAITGGNRNDTFSIIPGTGQLILLNKLEPKEVSDLVFILVVEANDTVNVASTNLTVNVKTVPYLNATDVSVPENTDTSGPYNVWSFQWIDLDGDIDPVFDILTASVSGVFDIVNSTLVTNATLDFEMVKNYTARIRITDTHGLSSNTTIALIVLDENDVTPNITSDTTLNLWERTETGVDVFTVETIDPDTVGMIEYSISGGNSDGKFALNASTGRLTLMEGLDFETTPSYNLKISANDSVNVDFYNLTINVKTSPVINLTFVSISEDVDTSSFYELLNLTATDPDGDLNPAFDIIDASMRDSFVIDGDTLLTNASLDFEAIQNYTVTVRVTDSVLGLTSNDTLTVLVTDVNDNAPEIERRAAPLEVREDTPTGTVVYTAQANDSDTVGSLSFSVTDGNTNSDFSIGAVSGNLTLDNPLNASAQINYILTLQVNDTRLTDSMTLTINIKTAPVMVLPENVTLSEAIDTTGNYSVLVLNSVDLDNDTNPTFEILQQSVDGTFFLSDSTTVLLTAAKFNFTDVNFYEVTIGVTDSSGMSSNGTLAVHITDANNLSPEFTSPAVLEIPEDQITGSVVYTAVAVDKDTVGDISYSIIDGNTGDVFSINAQSGNLTLVKALTPETVSQYALKLQANDTVNTDILTLTIDVKTIPVIVPVEGLTINETMDNSDTYVLLELNSTDLDRDPNPTYEITSQTVDGTFELTNGTLITTTATFDFETRSFYEIVVVVKDSSKFALSSSFTFNVTVLNADDEPPVFTSPIKIYIPEDKNTGTVVYTAVTYDNDTTDGIIFSIEGGNTNSDFAIDATSGNITLNKVLNPDARLIYLLQLQADDGTNQGFLNLTVNVVTAPVLLFPQDQVTIVENANNSAGTVLLTLEYQDKDNDEDPTISIVSQSVNDTFEFSADKTKLITTKTFDYEDRPSHEVVLEIVDKSPLKLSSTSTITVTIVDTNDVPPNVTSPASVKVLENTTPGTDVYTVTTEDPDGATASYAIIDGNTNDDFSINATSGNIAVVNELNVTAIANYSLVIQINDTLNVVGFTLFVELAPDINECDSNPCENGATCLDGIGEFTCNCTAGYAGLMCEDDIDECASDPCLNNATCQHGIDEYNCTCVDGFTGDNCQTDIDECDPSPCQNGTCEDLVNGYDCTCVPGYTGDNCSININECEPEPCQNNGTCNDGINVYSCDCVAGYNGDNCENDIDECASTICTNNGTCNNLINNFICTCQPGYTGRNCEREINECAGNPCLNSVTCEDIVNGYICICLDGYSGDNCETDINECASEPCDNGGTCEDGIDEFTCSCLAGYTGTTCQNQCASFTYGLGCNQDCACNRNGTETCDHVNGTCNCNAFFNGSLCDVDIDECANTSLCNKSNEGCDNIRGGYACACDLGYDRNATTDECEQATSTSTTTQVPATRIRISASVTLGLVLPVSVDLNVAITFNKYKLEVEIQLRIIYSARISTSFTIIITRLRKGSLIVDYDIIVDQAEVPNAALANADIATSVTGITVFDETARPTEVKVNNVSVPVGGQLTDATLCQSFEAASGTCNGDYLCEVRDGIPGCQAKEKDDNLPLILGLGIGIPAFFVALAVVVLCIAFYNNKYRFVKRKYRRDYDDRSNELYDRKLPVRANTGPPTWPFVASPEHAEHPPYADYSREGGQHYLPSEDFHGQYDNQASRDRGDRDSNYTWDYLFSHLRPGEPYHIRRPKLDYK